MIFYSTDKTKETYLDELYSLLIDVYISISLPNENDNKGEDVDDYGYVRCSSDIQDTQHQIESIKDYCKNNNIELHEIIKDEGVSAFRKDISARDGILRILQLAKEGKIEQLVVFETSRLSRGFYEGQNLLNDLTKYGIKVHSVTDNGIINADELSELMNAFKFWMNNKESKNISMRTKSALQMLKNQGLYYGGGMPWNMEIKDRKLVPINTEEIISFFEDYITYGTTYCMKKYDCSRMTVMNRIKNKHYKEIAPNLWNRANKLVGSRRLERSKDTVTNRSDILFEGLLYHHNCNHKLYISRDNRTKDNHHFYRCTKCRGNATVKAKKSFSGKKLDKAIEQEILIVLDSLNHDKLQEKYHNRCNKKKMIIELQINNLESEIKNLQKTVQLSETKLQRYILEDKPDSMINVITDLISKTNENIIQLETRLENKQKELQALESNEAHQEKLIENILYAKEIYSNASNEQKKAILNLMIKKIEVKDIDDFNIFLNI